MPPAHHDLKSERLDCEAAYQDGCDLSRINITKFNFVRSQIRIEVTFPVLMSGQGHIARFIKIVTGQSLASVHRQCDWKADLLAPS